MPRDLLFLTLAFDCLKKKKQKRRNMEDCWEEQESSQLVCGGNLLINHMYAACFNRKRPRHEQEIINVLHQPAVIKCIILSPPIMQTRLEVEMRGNSAFRS